MCIRNFILKGMQLVRSGNFAKSGALSSVVRNASCSGGWLRLLVQCIFAAITVTSFVLIVLLTTPRWPPKTPTNRPSRCRLHGCRVICREAPFFGDYEDDIILTLLETDDKCNSIFLILNNPMFLNSTLPPKWLSSLRTNIQELTITSGNLMHISPDAFMSQYTGRIRVVSFHSLILKSWTEGSLVGLSSLRRLYIRNCALLNMPRHALRAVDDTLETISIRKSGLWNPTNITGSTKFPKLTSVDFSSNNFKDILGPTSFNGIQNCKVLYLNSCKISAIGAGTFDDLHNIEVLFLQDNYLVTIPAGLFLNMISLVDPKPRINLQKNLWNCDCSAEDIGNLIANDMLLTDPICKSPDHLKNKSFTEFEIHCHEKETHKPKNISSNDTNQSANSLDVSEDITGFIYVSNFCYNGNESSPILDMKMFSPLDRYECPTQEFLVNDMHRVASFAQHNRHQIMTHNNWIRFTYLLKTVSYSMVQIGALEKNNFGLVWYQSSCPNEVYCISDIPKVLRLYDNNINAHYVFCPIMLKSGSVDSDNCIFYHHATFDDTDAHVTIHILFYVATAIVCLVFGAICVYAVILKYPYLLKGSKRILFVKHKTVDALVLPPKVPLRNELTNESVKNCSDKKIFSVSTNYLHPNKFNRNKSIRSSKSSSPSYISALQPTEDQLAEWRVRHHFNNDLSITSMQSELSTLSWIHNVDNRHYSLDVDNDRTYESLK